jgi:hypothetical protein
LTLETKAFFGAAIGVLRAGACRGAAFRAGFSALTAFFFAGVEVRLLETFLRPSVEMPSALCGLAALMMSLLLFEPV